MGRMNFDFLSSGKPRSEHVQGPRSGSEAQPSSARAGIRSDVSAHVRGRESGSYRNADRSVFGRAVVEPERDQEETSAAGAWQDVVSELRLKLEATAKTAASEFSVVRERVPEWTRMAMVSLQTGVEQVRDRRRAAVKSKAQADEAAVRGVERSKRARQGGRRRLSVSRWQGLAVISSLALAVGLTGLRAASKEDTLAVVPALPPTFTEAAQEFVAPQSGKRVIPGMTSRSYVVVDAATKEILVAKDADQSRSIASLTKLMSSMVYLDLAPDLNEVIEIKPEDRKGARPSHTRLQKGWKLTANDLLHAALIASENPAVEALARSTGLTRAEFVGMMNRKAQELGMTSSIFFDVSGLDSGNMASATDVARMVDAAGKYPLIHEIATLSGYDATVLNSGRKLAYVNSNRLARYGSFEVVAGKTGYISDAGYCLTLSIRQGGRELLMAFLNTHSKTARFADATRAAAWVAENAPTAVASNP